VSFRTVSDIWRAVFWIWRTIFSFPPAVIRHCLKHVNRCEASVGCCDCCWSLLIGPVIVEDRMTGQTYLEFLQNELIEKLVNVPLATRIAMYFYHDEAPPHYTWLVMRHLNDTFLNRWIGRGSTINWPRRSPDLTPLDFYLWAWMKSEVYRIKVDTRKELLNSIMDAIARIKELSDEQHAMFSHELQSALMLTVEFSKCITN
jgi:hypothetical protein